ncbi:MAG: glycogen synthase GlgA [Firmicutes bacterium]|nr:glycogen synthase GlgA [Bacillota bacterium]
MKKILFAASECVPFVKTGGLADVVGALPKAFPKDEFDVRVVLPYYRCIPEKFSKDFKYITHFYMGAGDYIQNAYVGIMEYEYDSIKYYFIDDMTYFNCEYPYENTRRDIEKFCYFCKAALSILPIVDFKPDIIHCHDWQTGLIPVYLKTEFQASEFYHNIHSIMTIHNLKFQGVWDIPTFKGLSGLPDEVFRSDTMEYLEDANMLKGGIVYADYITTVSSAYAQEIKTAYYGEGLDGLLFARRDSLFGIVNGIDYDIYDPKTDKNIKFNYTEKDVIEKKKKNKTALQKELGLPVDEDMYMIAIISRLTDQKGLDLVACVINEIMQDDVQLVVIGTGDSNYEHLFLHNQWIHKNKLSANILYSDSLAHRLYASADAMLMPSRFEPCGLTQLISLRYGTVPIVRETGGLRDTVQPLNEYNNTGTGFSFLNYNAHEMLKIIEYSKSIYYDRQKLWKDLVVRGMKKDFSWNSSKDEYVKLYDKLLTNE